MNCRSKSSDLYKKLTKWNFKFSHQILDDEDGVLRIKSSCVGSDETPSVYVWGSSPHDQVECIDRIEYVGKAGRGRQCLLNYRLNTSS